MASSNSTNRGSNASCQLLASAAVGAAANTWAKSSESHSARLTPSPLISNNVSGMALLGIWNEPEPTSGCHQMRCIPNQSRTSLMHPAMTHREHEVRLDVARRSCRLGAHLRNSLSSFRSVVLTSEAVFPSSPAVFAQPTSGVLTAAYIRTASWGPR